MLRAVDASFGLAAFLAFALSVASRAPALGGSDSSTRANCSSPPIWGSHGKSTPRFRRAMQWLWPQELPAATLPRQPYGHTLPLDGGRGNWAEIGAVPAGDIIDLLVHHDLSILLLTETGSLYRSTDQGATFTGLASVAASECVSLTRVEPTGPAYILTRRGIVDESADGGETWTVAGAFAMSMPSGSARWDRPSMQSPTPERFIAARTQAPRGRRSVRSTSSERAPWQGTTARSSPERSPAGGDLDDRRVLDLARVRESAPHEGPGDRYSRRRRDPGNGDPRRFPSRIALANPARTTGGLAFTVDLTTADELALELLDVNGRVRATRPFAPHPAGRQIITWQPAETPAGVYMVRVRTPSGVATGARWVRVR